MALLRRTLVLASFTLLAVTQGKADDFWADISGKGFIGFPTKDNFDNFVVTEGSVLVMFYAPWCVKCEKMRSVFAQAAGAVVEEEIGALAAVDATIEEELAERFNIRKYPTFKYYKGGKLMFEYKDGRTFDDLYNFMMNPKRPPRPEKKKTAAEEPEWSEVPSDVIHLTDTTFDVFIKDNKKTLVMFYAPWCGHCKKMKPKYVSAAARLKNEAPDAKLAAVDAIKFRDLCNKHSVKGYPTVKYFEAGTFKFDYKGGRTVDDLCSFMKDPKPVPPPPEKKKTAAEDPEWSEVPSDVNHLTDTTFDDFIKDNKKTLVMFYAPWCGHCKKMKPAYVSAAARLKNEAPNAKLAAVDAIKFKDLGKEYNVKAYPTLKYFENGALKSDYKGGRSEDDLVKFFNTVADTKDEL